MGHSHSHQVPPRVMRTLVIAVVPFLIATVVGLVLLWPADTRGDLAPAGPRPDQYSGTVTDVAAGTCEGVAQGDAFVCSEVSVRLDEGPDAGDTVSFRYARGRGASPVENGDRVTLAHFPDAQEGLTYQFVDFERSLPLVILAIVFAVFVVATSRWRGLTALTGLAMSIVILTNFMLPAILSGESPIAVAVVGSAAVMFVALYLAHGFNASTTTAVLGTLASLALTAGLALLFVEMANFTGLSSEEAGFLQVSADQINLEGLLLGGIIVGALGVLDDVTVTQASAVWEIHAANPDMGARDLYRSALRIGRDHIASTVNTLVLAYAGASLPLLLIFSLSDQGVGQIIGSEVMAEEVVRTLVGSIGLVASVPITTALAVVTVSHHHPETSEPRERPRKERRAKEWHPPRAEREWGDG
ncbi:MAG: YibE/F family protein [Actinomycetota bacterium]|nr:YibE/F family protein [Actinomycetota bacterium]